MKFNRSLFVILAVLLCGTASSAFAEQQQKAMDVLKSMAAFTSSVDNIVINAEVNHDARLPEGLLVTNPSEVTMKISRSASMYVKKFDGVNAAEIYIHEGKLTVYNSETGFYARADVPNNIQEAMQYALENFELDIPLGELFFAESAVGLIAEQDTILYLTDKSRVRGVDCHQLAVRGAEIDLQLWVEEGDRPAPRKMTMTMKWEGGAPRHTAFMDWKESEAFEDGTFEFDPPEGAQEIQFFGAGQ